MYKASVFNNISEVPLNAWNDITRLHPYTYSSAFLKMKESLSGEYGSVGYILIYDSNDQIVALTHFEVKNADVAIFSRGWIRNSISKIRTIFPDFLAFKILECAFPIFQNSGAHPNEINTHKEAFRFLGDTLLEIARSRRSSFIVIGAFEPQDLQYESTLTHVGYQFVPCLPTACLDIQWDSPDAYLFSMKSYYRSKLLKHLRINRRNGIRHEIRDNFEDLADILWQQWKVVKDHAAEYDDETLSPKFYKDFSQQFDTRSKVILIFANDVLIGHALLLLDGDTLFWRNFGRTKAENDSLYIYTCHQVIETAINLDVKRLDMGVTTYAIKTDLGASVVSRKIAVRATNNLFNSIVSRLYSLLNKVSDTHGKDVFKGKPTLFS